ncbi:double zinc ribbon domain-containing protein [Parablastomonas sp. CN1-191]|uniref:double zinc ribbon domain-containing protein n=1 Tax=Parablastomonas sp. CN1-191 TaxID=3400908 RepID=UPI003BF8BB0A
MGLPAGLAPLIDFVFPPRCPLCGADLAEHGSLCAACWATLAIPGTPCCKTCQRPFPDSQEEGLICAPCLADPPRHAGIAAGTLYNAPSRQLVLSFKHGRKLALAALMARLIAARIPSTGAEPGPDWTLVPVPLHRWRLWKRGYNQAALLAQELARTTGAALVVDGLKRTRPTPSLGGLGKTARSRALRGAIALDPRRRDRIAGRRVLLVDDVLTSGATSDACVAALLRGGASAVTVACFARVLDEAL